MNGSTPYACVFKAVWLTDTPEYTYYVLLLPYITMGKENPGFIQSRVQLESRMHPGFIQLSVQSSRELDFWIAELRSWMKFGYKLDPFHLFIYTFTNGLFYMHWA
jgi:hypothetical protein